MKVVTGRAPLAQRVLVDAGFIIALYDPTDTWHLAASDYLRSFHGQLFSVEPVITEACYFLHTPDQAMLFDHVAQGWLQLTALDVQAFARMAALVRKYADRPPDMADAALVWLAETTGIHSIVTVDVNDFSTYRINGKSKFNLLPWQSAAS
jgi:uncharacterized protein